MKKVAVALVVLIVLVVGALLVLPSFWDWNGEKGRMAALVKEQIGRDLTIAGDVSLRLLPTPAFAAQQVTLANLDGGSDPAMVRLDELRVSIGLLPLLRGEVLVKSVTLVKPEVLLEVLPDGRANWQFAAVPPAPGATGSPAAGSAAGGDVSGGSAAAQPIRIDSFLIEDGRVRYRDARSGREEMLSGLNAELAAESLAGPFAANGSAVYQGVPVAFDFNLGQLVDGGATAVSLSLQLPQAGASTTFIGALSRHEDLQTLRGRLQAEGSDFARVLRALPAGGVAAAAPGLLAQPFALSAELSGSNTEASAEAVKITFGPLSLDGKVAADLSGQPDITASLSAKTVDLDKLLALQAAPDAAPQGATAPPPSGAAAPAPSGGAAVALPKGFSAKLDLAAEALLYRGQTLRQLQVAARLADGQLEVTKAAVQLPGSSDVSLSGTVSADARGPRFNGTVAAESDNLRGLLHWLGITELDRVPAERLRRLVLKTAVEAAADQMVLRNTDLRLDVSRFTGGVAVALRQRPGIGLALNVDKVNLDAYLPPAGAPAPVLPQAAAPGQAEGTPAAPGAAAPPPFGLPLLGRFDANIDLRVGQLTYQGLPLDGLRLDATLQQGGLVVREFSIADLVGSRGKFTGSVANIDREPSIDGSLDVSVATLSRLVKVLGVSTGGPLPLESFTLSGAVNGTREELRFDQRLAALGGNLRAAGKVQLQSAAPAVDAAVELDHPDLSVLLGELLRDAGMPAGLGPAALQGRLAAGGSEMKLSGLEGRLAGVELLGGDLAVALAGPRPKITADLATGTLPLAALAAPAAGKTSAKKGSGGGSAAAPAVAGERWSHKPLDLSGLRAVDAEVTLSAKTLLADRLRLTDARIEAQLADGLLDVKRFTAAGYGGQVSLTGTADAREPAAGLQVAADVTATEVELKGLLRDLAGTDRFSGPVTLHGKLATRGASEAGLVEGLAGDGELTGTVTVAAKAEEQAGALVLDILGKKVKEIRGITDSTTMLFSAFAGAPAKVDGTFRVEQGVVRSDDLTVRGRDAVALTKGSVDLPDWQLDSTTDVYRDADPKNAYLTARLRGPLDGPDVAVSGQPFQRQQEPAASEPPAATEEPQQQPVKPEELLKKGLKSLLKGLDG